MIVAGIDLTPLIVSVLQVAIIGLIGYAGVRLRRWLETRDANTLSSIGNLASIVRWAITNAEISGLPGPEKKEEAIDLVVTWLQANGIRVTSAQMKRLADTVEAAVKLEYHLTTETLPPGWEEAPAPLPAIAAVLDTDS